MKDYQEQDKKMNIITYHIASNTLEEMLEKEESVTKRLIKFKLRHPNFSFKLEKEELTNTLIVKQLSMYESAN